MQPDITPPVPNREKMALPPVLGKIPWRKRVTTRIFFWFFLLLSLGFLGLGIQVTHMVIQRDRDALLRELRHRDEAFVRSFSLLMKHQDLVGARDLLEPGSSRGDRPAILLLKPDGHTPAFGDLSTILDMRTRGILLPTLGQARRFSLPPEAQRLIEGTSFQNAYQKISESSLTGEGVPFQLHPNSKGGVLGVVKPVLNGNSCRSCHNPQQDVLGYAVAYQSTDFYAHSIHAFGMKIFWAFLGTLELLVLLLVWTIRGKLVTPLVSVSGTVGRMSSGSPNLKTRLDVGREDEIGQLADFINRFIDLFQGWVGEVSEKVRWIGTQAEILSQPAGSGSENLVETRDRLTDIQEKLDALLPGRALSEGEKAVKDSLPDLVERSIILEKGLSESLRILSRTTEDGPALPPEEVGRIQQMLRTLESVLSTLEQKARKEETSLAVIREDLRELDRTELAAKRFRAPLEEKRIREILEMARELERELRRFHS
ncbi:HAMP domain-containing protein [Leptospirillum ferriphilum]|uniref:HAMP domain-containing protein n=1 Tax=Leptospirillum ferriphilum YSK TaxID=1441628 RepID=A0A059Y2S0_9BACT|nr:methyl-accepting chemotaxis protein [Leptospirillum ferriphilum]AIA31757.1 hypothetical protein Y981_07030 [Leptospirillum ferriphilum YSK]MCL5259051.1 methyl-accepting chemotaxis protein [Nitrospirota bacterium]